MHKKREWVTQLGLATALAAVTLTHANSLQAAPPLTPGEAADVTTEAYTFAYPLLANYRLFIHPASESELGPQGAGFNELSHRRALPPVDLRGSPQRDALETLAVIDLRREPMVLSVPRVPEGTGYLLQLRDSAGDVLPSISSLDSGAEGGDYVLVGPDFQGLLPAPEFDAVITTAGQFVILRGRVIIADTQDLAIEHALQDGMYLRPLSAFLDDTAPAEPPPVPWLPWNEQRASGIGVFDYVNMALAWQPPALREISALARFARIGVMAGQRFQPHDLPVDIAASMESSLTESRAAIDAATSRVDRYDGSWQWDTRDRTRFGGNYLRRAAAALSQRYPERPELLMYGQASRDANGEPLTGERGATIRFPAGALPPVRQHWSLSLYDAQTTAVYHNEEGRYSVGSHSGDLVLAEDGSLTLHIGHIEPSDPVLRPNWLPAPRGNFYLVLRLYGPQPEVLSGAWTPPTVLAAGE